MTENEMPRNIIESGFEDEGGIKERAEREGITEAEWRARNLPSHPITFRWKYANKTIQLYERRLHSLRDFHVGPALQAWVRSRLEWVADNKLYELRNGVIVLSIDPEGDVDINLEEPVDAPVFTEDELVVENAKLKGMEVPGTLWLARDKHLVALSEGDRLCHAADTLVRDLATTLKFTVDVHETADAALLEDAHLELFSVSDEFGVVPCQGHVGPVVRKMDACFTRLWTLE